VVFHGSAEGGGAGETELLGNIIEGEFPFQEQFPRALHAVLVQDFVGRGGAGGLEQPGQMGGGEVHGMGDPVNSRSRGSVP